MSYPPHPLSRMERGNGRQSRSHRQDQGVARGARNLVSGASYAIRYRQSDSIAVLIVSVTSVIGTPTRR